MSRKLRMDEYEPLLEKLRARFRVWAVKCLSFAERAQLISSMISGIVIFWISTFVMPQGCIKRIKSLCSCFLWSGSIDGCRGAKVAWSDVCLPKKEGGLDLKRFSVWIWQLFAAEDSL